MEELLKKLAEVRNAMKSYVGRELSDEENEKANELHSKAVKLETQIKLAEDVANAEKAAAEDVERRIKEAADTARAEEAAKARRLAMGDAPYVAKFGETSKFDNLSGGEIGFVIDTLRRNGERPSVGAFKALALRIGELKDNNTEESRKGVNYVKNAFSAITGVKADVQSIEAAIAAKAATDPMYTGGSGIGSDWVGTAYSQQMWESIRGSQVVNGIPEIVVPDGYSSIYIPLESSDPTWYKVSEATASDSTLKVPAATVTASQAATANKQITLAKVGARVLFTGEMTEDSLVAFAPEMRRKLEVSGREIVEHLFIDGDVETSANKNINSIDGTPGASDVYLSFDGFRKLALVTNTANSRSASGAFSVSDFKDTLKLMGTAGLNGADPTQVAFLLDYNTMWAALDLPELKTRDTFSQGTIENGFLTRIYNTQVLYAFQMHRNATDRKANTAGKVATGTPANNTTGAILAIRKDQWKQAFKRRMTLETTRIPNADSWEIVALCRLGLGYRDNEASAITYNVGI